MTCKQCVSTFRQQETLYIIEKDNVHGDSRTGHQKYKQTETDDESYSVQGVAKVTPTMFCSITTLALIQLLQGSYAPWKSWKTLDFYLVLKNP